MVLVYPTFCETYRTKADSAERIKVKPKSVTTNIITVLRTNVPATIVPDGNEIEENCLARIYKAHPSVNVAKQALPVMIATCNNPLLHQPSETYSRILHEFKTIIHMGDYLNSIHIRSYQVRKIFLSVKSFISQNFNRNKTARTEKTKNKKTNR